MKKNFSAVLADLRHDLRTPIGHIIGYSEMLDEELENSEFGGIIEKLKLIQAHGHQMSAFVDEKLGTQKKDSSELNFPELRLELTAHLVEVNKLTTSLEHEFEQKELDDLLHDIKNIQTANAAMSELIEDRIQSGNFEGLETVSITDTDVDVEKKEIVVLDSEMLSRYTIISGDILIVDDNQSNRDLFKKRLERDGHNVNLASGGHEAIEFLRDQKVDLILLDIVMPEMSGIEVLTYLKNDPKLNSIPVIMLSALDDMDSIINCILLGAEDYLFKPFNPVLLKARIAASLEKQRLRKQNAPNLRVFISSPGDVIPERRVVKRVLNDLNSEFSGQVYLTPILWEEEPLLASDTFQSQIYEPNGTDIFIGIFWWRFGTPLPDHIRRADGTRYGSGSEFEYEDAMAGYHAKGKPDILMYRKTKIPMVGLTNREDILSHLEQKELLEEFLAKWLKSEDGDSYVGAFHVFESEDQFEGMITNHLRKLVVNTLAKTDES